MGHNSYISNHPDFLLLPIPTGNEKYEFFLNQAKENLKHELDKNETFNHTENIEEIPEDELIMVRLALVLAQNVCGIKAVYAKIQGQKEHGKEEKV